MSELDNKIEQLQSIISSSNNIVFFGGAGVSTESGIKDFRSKDGLYAEKFKYDPEYIISHDFFFNHTSEFYEFYKEKMIAINALPNAAHKYLYELEKSNRLKCIITQNIDGLHQLAGNKNVIELHGSIHRNYCLNCHKEFDAKYVLNSAGIPICDKCSSLIKPDVVLYQEPLNEDDIVKAINYIENAEVLIVAGTSLVVYPANSFVNYYKGKYLVLINKDITMLDSKADLVIHSKIGEIFSKLKP